MIEELKLFPVPVIRIKQFLSPELCSRIVEHYSERVGFHSEYTFGKNNASTYANHDMHNMIQRITRDVPNLENFEKSIQETCNEYTRITGYGFVDPITSNTNINISMLTFQDKDSELLFHKHPNAAFVGVLYLRVSENTNKIFFHNPNPCNGYTAISHFTEYSFDSFWISPEIGELLLFPGWLGHSSNGEKNKENNRVFLTFNCV